MDVYGSKFASQFGRVWVPESAYKIWKRSHANNHLSDNTYYPPAYLHHETDHETMLQPCLITSSYLLVLGGEKVES
jgi:hypothetical protein